MISHISLFELNSLIRQTLDKNLAPSYWVVAEIGEIRMAQKGHCYLELVEKEEDNVCAKIKANIWAYTYRNICGWFESITGKTLQPGMKILAQVVVTYHEVYGISLNVKDIDPNFTLGERAKKRQQVIDRLKQDGIFDMNRELDLPLVPQRIAVISSPSAAGYEDFMTHIKFNPYQYQFDITLFRASMQGNDAKDTIIKALHEIHNTIESFDLVAIIRGGGAQVDLDCFDTYDLSSHIAQFPIPIITGIGHERDETIVDLVAHSKMKTPTAVAEFLLSGIRSFEENLKILANRIHDYSEIYLSEKKYELKDLLQKLKFNSKNLLSNNSHQLKQFHLNLQYFYKNGIKNQKLTITDLQNRLIYNLKKSLKEENIRINNIENNLKLSDPEFILRRGYSITKINGININKIDDIQEGAVITTKTFDKILNSKIKEIKKRED